MCSLCEHPQEVAEAEEAAAAASFLTFRKHPQKVAEAEEAVSTHISRVSETPRSTMAFYQALKLIATHRALSASYWFNIHYLTFTVDVFIIHITFIVATNYDDTFFGFSHMSHHRVCCCLPSIY